MANGLRGEGRAPLAGLRLLIFRMVRLPPALAWLDRVDWRRKGTSSGGKPPFRLLVRDAIRERSFSGSGVGGAAEAGGRSGAQGLDSDGRGGCVGSQQGFRHTLDAAISAERSTRAGGTPQAGTEA